MTNGDHRVDPMNGVETPHAVRWDRREFVRSLSALAGAAGLLGYDLRLAAAESLPETPKVRLVHAPAMCLAPQYIAEDLLHAEGFSEVEYVPYPGTGRHVHAVVATWDHRRGSGGFLDGRGSVVPDRQ